MTKHKVHPILIIIKKSFHSKILQLNREITTKLIYSILNVVFLGFLIKIQSFVYLTKKYTSIL